MTSSARRSPALVAGLAGALMLLGAAPAGAQVVVPPQADISRQRTMPSPLPPAAFDLRIQNPEKAPTPRAVDELEFTIDLVVVTGADHLGEADWQPLFAPLSGRRIVLQDLRDAARQLEQLYHARGFFLTRVVIPPQQVRDGRLEVRVIEGFVDAVQVDAPNAASRRLVKRMTGSLPDSRPLRFADLEERLLLVNDTPGLVANSLLRPGGVLGSSDLLVSARRRDPQVYAVITDSGSKALGPLTFAAGAVLAQPFGAPGSLDLAFNGAGARLGELRAGSLRYAMPLGSRGAVLGLAGLLANGRPGGEVRVLGVESRVRSASARARLPVRRSRANSVYVDIGLAHNRSRVLALGDELSDDRSAVAELGISWRQSGWLGGDMVLSATLFRGLPFLGGHDADTRRPSVSGFEPDFTRLAFQVQRTQPLKGNLAAFVMVQGQVTGDRLVSGEQISFGGSLLGRGSDPSLLVGESGIGVLGELRLTLPSARPGAAVSGVQVYTYADWAHAATAAFGDLTRQSGSLSSIGLGLRFTLFQRLGFDLQLADARRQTSLRARHGPRFNISTSLVF